MFYTSLVSLAANTDESSSIFFKSAAFTELEHMGHNSSSDFSKRLQWVGGYIIMMVSYWWLPAYLSVLTAGEFADAIGHSDEHPGPVA